MEDWQREESSSKTVKLSAEDLQNARRLLENLISPEHASILNINCISPASSKCGLRSVAEFALRVRQIRSQTFAPAMFGEPAWDLLLALYMLDTGGDVSVSNLARTAGTPMSTAVRWIDYLVEKQLVERRRSGEDRRVSWVALSLRGRQALECYFSQVAKLGAQAESQEEASIGN